MRPAHLLRSEIIERWPSFTVATPLRVLVSACLAGDACGVDGSSNGTYPLARRLLGLANVRVVKFCPEDDAFGTPRATPDIEGGDGFDVIEGRARVLADGEADWTRGLLASAEKMRDLGVSRAVHLALMMDISASCGSTVIYDGPRRLKMYRRGPGVTAALLHRAGIPIVSQRDERTLGALFSKLDATTDGLLTDGLDHHERPWYRDHFDVLALESHEPPRR